MKTKKFVSALLALVMVLTIAPMAAFAAENVTCGHADVTSYGYRYDYYMYSSTQHFKYTYWDEVCNTCFETDDGFSSVLEAHFMNTYSYTTDSEDGEEYRDYTFWCACNHKWADKIYAYEGYPTP